MENLKKVRSINKLQQFCKHNGPNHVQQERFNTYKSFQRENNGLKERGCRQVKHNIEVCQTLKNKKIIKVSEILT